MKLFKRNDLLVIIAVCVVSIIALVPSLVGGNNKTLTAVISVGGEVIERIELDENTREQTISLDSSPASYVEIKNKKVRFVNSECKGHQCEHYGWLEKPGNTAVCLPAKAVVIIKGEEPDIDVLAY